MNANPSASPSTSASGSERTPICCPIAVDAADAVGRSLDAARQAAAEGARLVEWRIDVLAEEPDPMPAIERLLRESPLPAIVTIRSHEEGGGFGGIDADRVSLFEAIGTSSTPPTYVDFELAAYRRSRNLRQKMNLAVAHPDQVRDATTRLILSTHDFDGRPSDLVRRLAEMATEPACAVSKIAWRARSLRDNLEAFDLLAERAGPLIALCMGDFGLLSRVLAPKFGGFLTFASLDDDEATAPGQPTIGELRERYRYDSIGAATRVYGVIGWPVAHSRSPEIHNAGFDAVGHDGVYLPLPVPPEWEHFKATVGALLDHARLDFAGASVTIPHKEHLVRLVRERGGVVERTAERIGAANTLIVDADGVAHARNTDAPALVEALAPSLVGDAGVAEEGRSAWRSKRIAVLGTGGVARAAAVGLAEMGASVVIIGRDPARSEALADELAAHLEAGEGSITAGRRDDLACGCFHAFVNGTPIGMAGGPAPDESPLPDDVHLDDTVVVLDTVYTPEVTPLIADARERGAKTVTGLSMFIGQAALQFQAWTGVAAPFETPSA